MTTRDEISGWFDRGVKQSSAYMIVVCDTFDHDDYPVYTSDVESARAKVKSPGEMQRVMEVYDLKADKAEQMAERRAFRLPAA